MWCDDDDTITRKEKCALHKVKKLGMNIWLRNNILPDVYWYWWTNRRKNGNTFSEIMALLGFLLLLFSSLKSKGKIKVFGKAYIVLYFFAIERGRRRCNGQLKGKSICFSLKFRYNKKETHFFFYLIGKRIRIMSKKRKEGEDDYCYILSLNRIRKAYCSWYKR